MNDILALSIFLIAGCIVGSFVKKLKLPALVGYIIVGIVLGPPLTNIINETIVQDLDFIGVIALGFIAFIIGSRIDIKAIKKRKRGKDLD